VIEPLAPTPAAVSVVICAYTEERWNDLVAAVESVHRQSCPALETILVSDHNPSLLRRMRLELPGAVAIENCHERGLSGARNSGVAVATGSVIAFLDDDAVAEPDWLEHLTADYADSRVMGVGGSVEPSWPEGRPRSLPDEFDWVVGCTYRGVPTTASPVRNLIGANMSFRREVFQAVGGFRCGMGRVGKRPMGCEETELCIRAARLRPGSMMLFDPRVRVSHRVAPDRMSWAYFRRRCYSEGLSKALVSRHAGSDVGLSSERTYVLRILPRGVARGLGDALMRGDLWGLSRAAAIVSGLALTSAGFLVGAAQGRGSVAEPLRHASNSPGSALTPS
jgi:glucosyl-dolichyl phosphate glucuronosyltransferase